MTRCPRDTVRLRRITTSRRRDDTTMLCVFVVVFGSLLAASQFTEPTPDDIFKAVALRDGDTVCEIGAGDGALSVAAARLVGSTGRVHTSELPNKLRQLHKAVTGSGLTHGTVVEGHHDRTNFPDATCDVLLLKDVYHHLSSPSRINSSIFAAVRPGGRVAVVDFTPPGAEAIVPADRASDGMHGVRPDTVVHEMKRAGFEAVSTGQGDRWFVVILTRPKTE